MRRPPESVAEELRWPRERELPRDAPGRRDHRDKPGDPVVGALGDLERLGVEEEDLLEVLLQATRAFEIALEGVGRRGVDAEVSVLGAVRELVREPITEPRFDRGHERRERRRMRRPRRREAREPALRPCERLEQTNADVLVREASLAADIRSLVRGRANEPLARRLGDLRGGIDPDREHLFELAVRRGREERAGETAMTRERVARARELARHRERAPAQLVDRDRVAVRRVRHVRAVEARERLQVVPRRVASVGVRRDLELDAEAVLELLRARVARQRNGEAPLEPRGVVHRELHARGSRSGVGRRLRHEASELGSYDCHREFTQPSRKPRLRSDGQTAVMQ